MTELEWFNAALDIRYELANRVETLGFEHVKVVHDYRAVRDQMEYNIYFCSDEGRQRITVYLDGDSDDVDGLVRSFAAQYQDQLFSNSEN